MFFWMFMLVLLFFGALQVTGIAGVGEDEAGESRQLLYLTILGSGMILAGTLRLLFSGGGGVRYIFSWLTVIAIMVTGFSRRGDIEDLYLRLTDEQVPSVALTHTGGEAELRRAWDGHYRADAKVNGIEMRLLVDTGASMVVLPYEAASDLGIDPATLDFSVPVTTANGRSTVAPVRLASITIGQVRVANVTAAIAHPGKLKTGLLGMSFLDKMNETVFQGDRLILRQDTPDGGIADAETRFKRVPTQQPATYEGMFSPEEMKDQPPTYN